MDMSRFFVPIRTDNLAQTETSMTFDQKFDDMKKDNTRRMKFEIVAGKMADSFLENKMRGRKIKTLKVSHDL